MSESQGHRPPLVSEETVTNLCLDEMYDGYLIHRLARDLRDARARVNDLERKLAICREALMEAAEALHGCAIPAGGCDDAMVLLDALNHIEAALAATKEEK